jgi:hypothetical protein
MIKIKKQMILRYEAFAKHAPYIEKLSIDQNRWYYKITNVIDL